MTQITLLAKTAPTDCLIVSSIGRDYEKKTVKIIWKTKIKREVTKFSIYYSDLLKISVSSRSVFHFEKKSEIRESSSQESNKSDCLSEGRHGTQGNHDNGNKKLPVNVKNMAA